MAINLNKKEDKINWYYSENGSQQGPFNLNELIKNVQSNTMVWREGIEWTTAKLVPELAQYFTKEEVSTSLSENAAPSYTTSQEISDAPQNMFVAPFSFDGRIRRKEYGLSLIFYFFGAMITNSMLKNSSVLAFAYIPLLWFMCAQGAKRCHDRNASGWYQIIPFYALWMLFAEGEKAPNEFGNSPK
jgi:uncharacterized membrane protein YhaH (DUF805 family)